MPGYLIAGAMRAGTTALHTYLVTHPAIGRSTAKEIHYFSLNYHRGPAWYRGHFPTRLLQQYVKHRYGLELISGEATPYYMFHPQAPYRIASLLPDVKLIIVLRNPVDRAYSHFMLARKIGVEPLPSFEEALAAEPQRLAGEVEKMSDDPCYRSHSHWLLAYVMRGMYIDQLERLHSLFPEKHILVLTSEELLLDPAAVHGRVLQFLGLPIITLDNYPQYNSSRYPPMKTQTRLQLTDLFAEANQRLYEYLGKDLQWE
jgi:hypothetical protein